MYYLQSRYYDPQIARFISPDEVAYLGLNGELISQNLFLYCYNNPVYYSDNDGTSPYGALTLLDYAVIHKMVQGRCCVEYGWEMEICVQTNQGVVGYLDLLKLALINKGYQVNSIKEEHRNGKTIYVCDLTIINIYHR